MLGVKALLIGEKMTDFNQSLIPLCEATWELDRSEGEVINGLKATHTAPISEGIIEGKEEVALHGSWGSLKGTGFRYGTSDRILKIFGNPSMVLYSNR